MNKLLYRITAWILIIAGGVCAITNVYYNELAFGLIISALIITLSFLPAKNFLKISDDETKQNRLTNTSLTMTIVGMLLIIVTYTMMLITCPQQDYIYGDCFGLIPVFIFGIFPAAALYGIAVILLLVDRFKK